MHGGKPDTGERGEEGHEHGAGQAARQIVEGHGQIEEGQVVPLPKQQDKQQIGGRSQHRAEHHHAHHGKPLRQEATEEAAGNRHQHAEGFHRPGNLVFAEAHIGIKHIGNHPGHDIRNAV